MAAVTVTTALVSNAPSPTPPRAGHNRARHGRRRWRLDHLDRFGVPGQHGNTNATTLRLKVWRTTAAEPTAWLSSVTDATPATLRTAGHPGVQLYTSSSWTGAAPIARIDDLRVAPPA